MNFHGLLRDKTDEEKLDIIFNKYPVLTGEKLRWNDLFHVLSGHRLLGLKQTKDYIFKSENPIWIGGYLSERLYSDMESHYRNNLFNQEKELRKDLF